MTDNTASEDDVLLERHGPIAVLTLHAPERRNALSPDLRLRLRERLRVACHDGDVRVIVLTGAQGTFSAGGDIRTMGERPDPVLARQRLEVLHDTVRLILAGPKPVIAAVEGHAFGAGFSLAAACDHVVAAEGASFCASFSRIGLVADCGLFWSLPQRVGAGCARDLLLSARVVDAAEAKTVGIVDRLVPKGGALKAALEKAQSYLPLAPLALAATKSALARHPAALDDALAMEADLQASLRVSADHLRACEAFLAKRPVVFEGC